MTAGQGRTTPLADINTRLIDVMLVLLIAFMLVVPVAQRGIESNLPRPPGPSDPPAPTALVLTVGDVGLTLNTLPTPSLSELEGRLRDLYAGRADRTLFVRASGTVPYGKVIEAIDAACGAGADRIGLIR